LTRKSASYLLCGAGQWNELALLARDGSTQPTFCGSNAGRAYAGRTNPHCHPYSIQWENSHSERTLKVHKEYFTLGKDLQWFLTLPNLKGCSQTVDIKCILNTKTQLQKFFVHLSISYFVVVFFILEVFIYTSKIWTL